MAVKLNETTNFTVLWPDLRGHGENPPVNSTSFGAQEGDDVTAAIDYLRTLKSPTGKPQIGQNVGIYGVGLGAYVALDAASRYAGIRALALDSVPASPDDVVRAATITRTGLSSSTFQRLAHVGVRIYGFGRFPTKSSCDLAQTLRDVHVLLLTGVQDQWQQSTLDIAQCLKTPPEIKKGLNISGVVLPFTTGEQEETYDRPVIEFFGKSLQ
jgi:pimeloyl-ACP methyl ester carboxylesterase